MILLFVLLAAATPPIVLDVEEVVDVPADRAAELADRFARALGAAGGASVARTALDHGACASQRCLHELRSDAPDSELILIRLYGSPSRVRLVAERFRPPTLTLTSSAALEIRRDSDDFDEELRLAASKLLPRRPSPEPPPPIALLAPPDTPLSPWPFVAGGVALAALTTGVILGLVAESTRTDLEGNVLFDAESSDKASTLRTTAITADIMFATAGVGALASLALLLFVP